MKWQQLSYEQQLNILAIHDASVKTDKKIADTLIAQYEIDAKPASFRRYLGLLRDFQAKIAATGYIPAIPPSPSPLYTDYLNITTDNAMIISDIEIPDHDELWLERALQVGKKHNIKNLIIAGDLVATDNPTLTEWVSTYIEDKETTYRTAIDLTRNILNYYKQWFDDIYLIEGNHDDRIARKTGGQVSLDMLLHDCHIKYSRYSYLWVKSQRDYTYICHPENYSKNSIGLGQQIYNVIVAPDGTKPNVILAHTHQPQRGLSPDGQREIIALGTIRHKLRTRYKNMKSNKHHEWGNQFVMLWDSHFYDLHEFTDWRKWV